MLSPFNVILTMSFITFIITGDIVISVIIIDN